MPPSADSVDRLPCRGCLPTCKNYPVCDGKPWRALDAAVAGEAPAERGTSNRETGRRV
ncbi:hypothetical protein [Marinimicrobium agarilyticum]|uniref:hypothetical protein n=1 Tax=Marinimicrobium agarilyticum TaxID=306546 RepID=UPI0004209D3A|nr:hypothetical protein [Marinimicrobium agarilyticum]